MSKKRGVYHRRKANLNGLFPTGKEEYLCTSFMLGDTATLRMVFFNKALSARKGVWSYAKEALAETKYDLLFATLTQKDFLVYDAIDRFNNGGPSSFVKISSEAQFKMAIDEMVCAYEAVADVLDAVEETIYVDESGNPVSHEQLREFPSPTEEEINICFQ